MKRLLVALVTFFALVFGNTAPGLALASAQAQVDTAQVASHKVKHDPKGKAKGHNKKAGKKSGKGSKDALSKPKKDKKNKGKNNKKDKDRKGKKGGKDKHRLNNPKADQNGGKANGGKSNRKGGNNGQPDKTCVIIEKPIKTVVEYRTKTQTKTEKVLEYGLMALVAVAAALLALYIGYVLGWRGSDRHEQKAWEELLEEDKDN